MWVLASLRHRQFFSLGANAALVEKIEEWNNRPFAPPREGSRFHLTEHGTREDAAGHLFYLPPAVGKVLESAPIFRL